MHEKTTGGQVYRQLTQSTLARATETISAYYDGDEEQLKRDLESARREQTGVIGDLAVIAWIAGQMEIFKATDNRAPPRKKKRK